MARSTIDDEIADVVSARTCSGCGACCLIDAGLTMSLDGEGFLRPTRVDHDHRDSRTKVGEFRRTCPGLVVESPRPRGARRDPTLGSYLGVWSAWAADPQMRDRGSSGGVLTALADWLTTTGVAARVVGAAADPLDVRRTVTVSISTREEALAAAGSRYAPVANASDVGLLDGRTAAVLKPCEASALRGLVRARPGADDPVVLSFLCAGTPSQRATESLLETLGVSRSERLSALWYRGRGWPGRFTAVTADQEHSSSYDESWGRHLGPTIQWRCKICPDGVGESSDVTASDFWETDAKGYPTFVEGPGRSALISRTPRGHQLVLRAIAEGVLIAEPSTAEAVARIQPYQRGRKSALLGRMIGSVLAGRRVPTYRGFGLVALAVRNARLTLRAARGTMGRVRASRTVSPDRTDVEGEQET